MIKTINDIVRSNIFGGNTQDMEKYIMNLDKDSYSYVIRVLLSDYYKMMMFYSKMSYDDSIEVELRNTSIDALVDRFNNDLDFKTDVLSYAKKFYSLSDLSKAHLMDILNKLDGDEVLSNIFKNYSLDMLYALTYDLEDLKLMYSDYVNKEHLMAGEDISLFIAKKLIEYSEANKKEYEKIVLELIKKYYMRVVYLMENFSDEVEFKQDNYLYISFIKTQSIDVLIKLSMNDTTFLSDLVYDYLENSVEEFIVDDDVIEEYFDANADEDIKEKFKKFE